MVVGAPAAEQALPREMAECGIGIQPESKALIIRRISGISGSGALTIC